jgi:hypothetical protein
LSFGTSSSLADHWCCRCSRNTANAVAATIREWRNVLKLNSISLGIPLLLLLLPANLTGFIPTNASGSGMTRHI